MLLIGNLLFTRDGTYYGNGIIYGRLRRRSEFVYQIETDYGTRVEMGYRGVMAQWSISQEAPMSVDQWREDRLKRIQEPFPDPTTLPVACPFCGGDELSEIGSSAPADTVDGVTGVVLSEWQCRGGCEGRSFWV